MSLMDLISRLLGRDSGRAEVTDSKTRDEIRKRQDEQEARLRALDIQAGWPPKRSP